MFVVLVLINTSFMFHNRSLSDRTDISVNNLVFILPQTLGV